MKYVLYFVSPVVIFLIILLLYIVFIKPSTTINLSQAAVIKEIKDLDRLETSQFTVEKIIDANTDNGNFIKEFLFGDRILLIAHGQVVAGVDLSKIEAKNIRIQGKNLSLDLPKTQILNTSLDSQKTRVYDRRRGLLAPDNKDLETQVRQAAEKSIQQAACEEGILQDAAKNAEKQLVALFMLAGFSEVTVHVQAGVC
jgi:hypothetical protein